MTLDEHVASAFSHDQRVEAVYLLGSAANGQLRPDSDVDIALLTAPGMTINAVDRQTLASKLALTLGREVDVGLLSSANLVYAFQTIMTGRRLFTRNSAHSDITAASLLGLYAQFNSDRQEVCRAYRS